VRVNREESKPEHELSLTEHGPAPSRKRLWIAAVCEDRNQIVVSALSGHSR
jgi:hypothetical protein